MKGGFAKDATKKVDATKKIDLWKLPPVLMIHLKRFEFDTKTACFQKTDNRLSMKLSQLDLGEFCSSVQKDGAVYNVMCVANHSGMYGGGHYTASCRVGGVGPGTWHHFNDETITPLSGKNVVTRETYVIFLMRDEDPSSISKSIRGSGPKMRPLLLRRQTPSMPENWPHPESLVSAVLRSAGHVQQNDLVSQHNEHLSSSSAGASEGHDQSAEITRPIIHNCSNSTISPVAPAPAGSVEHVPEDQPMPISSPLPGPRKRQRLLDAYFIQRA